MVAVIPLEVLESLAQKILVSLESEDIHVLPLRRKFLIWKVRDFNKSFGSIKKENRDLLYAALVKVSTEVDGLRENGDDPEWLKATRSFVASRAALEVFQDELRAADAVLARSYKMPFRIGRRKDDFASDFVSDLRTDVNRASKIMAGTSFDDAITKKSRDILKKAKLFFEKAEKAGKISNVVKLLAEPHGEFHDLQKTVKENSERETSSERSISFDFTTPQVFQLDLSIDYVPTGSGGYWFKSNEDGTSSLQECFVFLPSATTHVLNMWVDKKLKKRFSWQKNTTGAFDFKVTINGIERWVKRNTTKSSDSKSFKHEGHSYEVSYSSYGVGGSTWSTIVDGNDDRTVLSHQQWVDAKKTHDFQAMIENAENEVDLKA